jgi:hypothetical protein
MDEKTCTYEENGGFLGGREANASEKGAKIKKMARMGFSGVEKYLLHVEIKLGRIAT